MNVHMTESPLLEAGRYARCISGMFRGFLKMVASWTKKAPGWKYGVPAAAY
jgi:hypothetical protein